MIKAPSLSVGEVATHCQVPISVIRFYESKGLIKSWRSASNRRRYPRAVLQRLALIRVARNLGMSLSEISASLAEFPIAVELDDPEWIRLLQDWRKTLNRRINRMQQLQDELTKCIDSHDLQRGYALHRSAAEPYE